MSFCIILYACTLTNTLVSGVEELCEGSGGSFCLDGLGGLLILSQLTQHPCSHTLDVLDRRIQQLHRHRHMSDGRKLVQEMEIELIGRKQGSPKMFLIH